MMIPAIVKSGLAVSAALLLSRMLGFAREAAIAGTLGTSRDADIAVFLIGLPDFLVNVLGAGGFTAVLVVAFRRSVTDASRLLFQSSLAILGAASILSLLLVLGRDGLIDVLAPGFNSAARSAAIDLLPFALLSIPLAAMTGASVAFLQARERFFLAALGGAIINLVLVGALFGSPQADTVTWVAAAILAAALLRWIVLIAAIGRPALDGWSLRPWLVSRKMAADFVRTAAAEAVVFFYPFALRAMATLFGVGGLAAVNYATKLVQLPLGVVIMTVTTVMLPRLAGLAPGSPTADPVKFHYVTRRAQYWIIGLGLLSVVMFWVHSRWLVEVAFGWGTIGAEDLDLIALYTRMFSLSLVPAGLNIFLRRTLNALDDTRSPLIAELVGFAGFLILAGAVLSNGGPLEQVLLAAAGGSLCATIVLLHACHKAGAPLARTLSRPGLWAAAVFAGAAGGSPGLLVQSTKPEGMILAAIAIITGGTLGLLVLGVGDTDLRNSLLNRLRR